MSAYLPTPTNTAPLREAVLQTALRAEVGLDAAQRHHVRRLIETHIPPRDPGSPVTPSPALVERCLHAVLRLLLGDESTPGYESHQPTLSALALQHPLGAGKTLPPPPDEHRLARGGEGRSARHNGLGPIPMSVEQQRSARQPIFPVPESASHVPHIRSVRPRYVVPGDCV